MTEQLIWIFILNSACSLVLTGIIWYVQVVHYPSLLRFEKQEFQRHHKFHSRRTAYIVAPFMIAELLTSFLLVYNADFLFIYHLLGLSLVLAIWLSTFFIQIPIHLKLRKGFDDQLIQNLTDSNWLRTIMWSAKALISLQALLQIIA